MKSSEYWEEAALHREIAVQEGATVTAKELLRLYDEALDDIENEIKTIKRNFQLRYGIDNETAEYFLSRAQREGNLEKLIEALDVAPDAAAREKILEYIHRDGLSVRAYSARIERYRAVQDTIYARIKNIAAKGIPLFEKMLTDAYKESYYGNIDDYAKEMNVGVNFAILNDRAVKEAVNTPWEGARFSERIWKHTDDLASKAQDLVTKAIMSGESLTKTGQKLQAEFGVEKYRAMTLVRTETAHAHNMADLKAYEDLGEEEYKWLSTLDYATCTLCQPLDGQVFRVKDAREGLNLPPLHPNCRCTTTVNMKYTNRRARNPVTGRNEIIDGDTTYSEWVKNMTPEQKQALKLAQKKNSNRVADKEQWARYKKVLDKENVPKTFDLFQQTKYNSDRTEYDKLKSLYRNKLPGVNFAKASDVFLYEKDDIPATATIMPKDIIKNLKTSPIGRETIEYIKNNNVAVHLVYEKQWNSNRGDVFKNDINIYIQNTESERIAAQTVIHEVTHTRYEIGKCQWAEAVCMAQEKKHIIGRDELTFAEKRQIVKLAKDNYPEFHWKKGGYKNGKYF